MPKLLFASELLPMVLEGPKPMPFFSLRYPQSVFPALLLQAKRLLSLPTRVFSK
jgi:hypothetical protein